MDNHEETVLTLEELEKSWNDSKDVVLTLLGEDTLQKSEDDVLEKSEASDDGEDEGDDEEDDDDDEDEDVKKSLSDSMAENPEAQDAMDVEPFLTHLVKSMEEQFQIVTDMIKSVGEKQEMLEKAVKGMTDLQKATSKMFVSYGELNKSIAETVEAIGNAPRQSNSVLRKSGDRFNGVEQPKELNMSKDEIMLKAMNLRKEGKLTVRDVTKLENRLNKGIEIPEFIQKLLKEEK